MKKHLLAAAFITMMMALPAVAHAGGGGGGGAAATKPGCNPEVLETQKNRADAMRVRDKAFEQELVKRNDTTLGMTCFDQAQGVTAQIGQLFSDKPPSNVPAANTVVFTPPLAYPNWGADSFLIQKLETVILPPLQQHIDGFDGSISSILGSTFLNTGFQGFLSTLTAPITSITSAINGFSSSISSIISAINTIQSIASSLSLPLPSPVIIGITTALNTAQSVANSLMSALQSAMNAAIQPMITALSGQITSNAANMTCDVLKDHWDDDDVAGGAESVQGHGLNSGVPYGTYFNFIQNNLGGGSGYTGEMDNNSDVLDRALADLTGPLLAPGTLSSWRTVPIIPNGSSVWDVIATMN